MKVTEELLKAMGFSKANGRGMSGDMWYYDSAPYTGVEFHTDNHKLNLTVSDVVEKLVEHALEYYESKIT